jgi:hypothetical protein
MVVGAGVNAVIGSAILFASDLDDGRTVAQDVGNE